MRDMIMVNTASNANELPRPTPSPLSLQQQLAARDHLCRSLQMTLDLDELLTLFFQHIQPMIRVSGLILKFSEPKDEIKIGQPSTHHCDYRLITNEGYLGEIIFSRNKRFVETEMTTIEALLGSLVYPLRNALRYQTVLRYSLLDPLTLLGNRTALDTTLRRELQLAERYCHEVSLLMIDVDFFKQINDQYGHSRGDLVLREIAQVIQRVCRVTDMTFRYGGEEFVVVLGKTDTKGATVIAERIRSQIENTLISHNGNIIRATVSIGIATNLSSLPEPIDDLFERADKALYEAKAAGKNCVMNNELASLVSQ